MAEAPNGSAQPSAKGNGARKVSTRRGFIPWSISLVARLTTWAAILTILLRCPPTLQDCDESSPFVCKHYFRVKNAVTPHVKPYYDQYAAPYVEIAQPYYDTVKTNLITPVGHYAVHYGEPWVVKGRDYALAQWEINGQPRIAQLQAVSQAQYDKNLAPHVSKAVALAEPYYNAAKTQSLYAVDSILYPAYEFSRPYAIHGYEASHNFAVTTVLPAARWTWTNTHAFLDRAVWPQLRVVYVENVEPQLVRIGERLGRYKSHAKNKTQPESSGTLAPSSSSSATGSATQSSYVSKPTPQNTTPDSANGGPSDEPQVQAESSRSPVEAPEPEENESDRERKVREMVANDLESWQEKFAAQAEQGAAEIEDSVDAVSRRMIDQEANVAGVALIQQLQDTITIEISNLKEKMKALVSQLLEGDDIDVNEQTIQLVRTAGIIIKSKAQAIRNWREQYDEDLQNTVLSTSDGHFAILDETRSLALQQIGMKWAWSDGITYKDWAKYHELKGIFSDWTEELKQLIVTHPTLLEAQDAAVQIEERGMAIASAAAKELASLKEVVQWKIDAEDVTDEFDADSLRAVVEERARLAEEARLKAEEEARLQAEEEARTQAEEEARVKAEEDARAAEAAESEEHEDVRIHSMKESIESKPLVSVNVDVEYTEEDERIRSVKEASTSHPLISESAVPEAEETDELFSASATEEPTSDAGPEETPADADDHEEEKPAVPEGGAKKKIAVPEVQGGNGRHGLPVQPPDADAVDR